MKQGIGYANPSLALAKYWGKDTSRKLIPAVSSIGISLIGLESQCEIQVFKKGKAGYGHDTVTLNEIPQEPSRYTNFFDAARSYFSEPCSFALQARNTFPTAAGLASSSSGFAAAARAVATCATKEISVRELSSLARRGSISAARAVFGGFVRLPKQAEYAEVLYPASHWPELCVIVACVTKSAKAISSRDAMAHCQKTSPYFPSWLEDAELLATEIENAITDRNLQALGMAMRASYLRMFSTMFSAKPPIIYWTSDSMKLIHEAENLRKKGIPVWETMDAGPQVKFLTTKEHSPSVCNALQALQALQDDCIVCTIGDG